MSLKPLPIGTDLFRKLRENNAYYVDKTSIIKEIVTNASIHDINQADGRLGRSRTIRGTFEKTFAIHVGYGCGSGSEGNRSGA